MGEVLAVSLTAHAPTVMMPKELRYELNDGKEISLVPGLNRMRDDKISPLDVDTIIICDSHWHTTVEHVITGQDHWSGTFTSAELPRGMAQIPFDYAGDPELADAIASYSDEVDTPLHASHDPHLPIFYATINLVKYLHTDQRVVSVSIAQTGTTDDFQRVGRAIGKAVAELDRKVVILASGGMSHRFWTLKEIPKHESSDPVHIITPEARAADEERIEWMKSGDHARIVDMMDDYRQHAPEARFGHFLMMQAAVGGRDCVATGEPLSDYENATGTGQIHVWFDRPDQGWTATGDEIAGVTSDQPAGSMVDG